MTQPVLLGGLFIGVLSALPIISVANCCCLWIVSGGMLAAYLTQQGELQPITPGRGAWTGLLAGLVGAVVWLVVAVALDAVLAPFEGRMIEQVLQTARDLPPAARQWLELAADRSSAPARHAFGFALYVFGALFALLGGLLGAVFFRRDTPSTPPNGIDSPSSLPH